jgi:hypothetical protein
MDFYKADVISTTLSFWATLTGRLIQSNCLKLCGLSFLGGPRTPSDDLAQLCSTPTSSTWFGSLSPRSTHWPPGSVLSCYSSVLSPWFSAWSYIWCALSLLWITSAAPWTARTSPVWLIPDMVTQFWSVKVPVRELVGIATNLPPTGPKLYHSVLLFSCVSFYAHSLFYSGSGRQNTDHQPATIAMTRPLCFLLIHPECFLHFVKQDRET